MIANSARSQLRSNHLAARGAIGNHERVGRRFLLSACSQCVKKQNKSDLRATDLIRHGSMSPANAKVRQVLLLRSGSVHQYVRRGRPTATSATRMVESTLAQHHAVVGRRRPRPGFLHQIVAQVWILLR